MGSLVGKVGDGLGYALPWAIDGRASVVCYPSHLKHQQLGPDRHQAQLSPRARAGMMHPYTPMDSS